MPKDTPSRNPNLSPAGLPPAETSRHRHVRTAGPSPATAEPRPTCRFVSSQGGTLHCKAEPYQNGFCRFHHHCLVNGEISPLGKILDCVKDQERRREINQHGMAPLQLDRLEEDPLTGPPRGHASREGTS
jgi:hypothetical protein